MAYQEVRSLTNEWKPSKAGESIEGIYKKFKDNVGVNKSNTYTLEIDDASQKNGKKLVSLWGSTVLDEKMKDIPLSSKIKIEYLGEKKNYNNFKVYVDDGKPASSEDTPDKVM